MLFGHEQIKNNIPEMAKIANNCYLSLAKEGTGADAEHQLDA